MDNNSYQTFYELYIYRKWDLSKAKEAYSNFSAEELSELEANIIQNFNSYKYITMSTKERVIELFTEVLSKDMSIRIWANISPKYEFKNRLAEYLDRIGRNDILDLLNNNLTTGELTYSLSKGKPGNTLSKLNESLKSLLKGTK